MSLFKSAGLLMGFFALGIAQTVRGQTDSSNESGLVNTAGKSVADEATIFVYRGGKLFGSGWHALIYVNDDHSAVLHRKTYMEAKVHEGKVYIAGVTPNVDGPKLSPPWSLDYTTNVTPQLNVFWPARWLALPECSDLNIKLGFVAGGVAGPFGPQMASCLEALTRAQTENSRSLPVTGTMCKPLQTDSGIGGCEFVQAPWRYLVPPTEEIVKICDLDPSAPSAEQRAKADRCGNEIAVLESFIGQTARFPFHISFDVQAGKTYYVRYTYTISAGKLELMEEAVGAKEMSRFHPAQNK